jgi:NADPH:quinone reductase-like Zn-dependent oxidoreductase
VTVLSSTRSDNNIALLERLGCSEVFIENENISDLVRESYPAGINSVMDIVGNNTLLDSLKMVKKGGVVCNAGFLGGGDPFLFNPLLDMPPSVNLNFFASWLHLYKDSKYWYKHTIQHC